MTPLVIDLDRDQKPEIVFVTYGGGDLVALRGADCQELWRRSAQLQGSGQIAAGDLDGDGYPEIVGLTSSRRLAVYDYTGTELATAAVDYQGTVDQSDECGAVAIANLDATGEPEIVLGGQVARFVPGQGIQVLLNNSVTQAPWGTTTVVADLDGDNVAEVITGREVYDGQTGANKTPTGWSVLTAAGAYPAVADFNNDQNPDIVLVQSATLRQTVSVWDWANQRFIFGPVDLPVPGVGWVVPPPAGGPPTVADFDGDGVPDIGSAALFYYYVFSMKCWPNAVAGCAETGILWKKFTVDRSSGGTASSVFDFNGDGKAEVVYRDECYFRVIDGSNGRTVSALPITSGTALEHPVVADVDSDGHADVVVPSDSYLAADYCMKAGASDPDTGTPLGLRTSGIFVLRDPRNRWMPSRTIWNQSTYHITNVNDDGSIPTLEAKNWLTWNNYRQNVQGSTSVSIPFPDLTGGEARSVDPQQANCTTNWVLYANICNRGAVASNGSVSGAFYQSDPRLPQPKWICTATTNGPLAPGECQLVSCGFPNPPAITDLWFRANDDGQGGGGTEECRSGNDILYLPNAACAPIG